MFDVRLNQQALGLYFQYACIPAPQTIWQEVSKVPPAHYGLYKTINGVYIVIDLPEQEEALDFSVEDLKEQWLETVKTHLESDEEIGLFLSGGLDSSAIAYANHQLDHQLKAFCIGFDHPAKDEKKRQKRVAQKCGFPLMTKDLHAQSMNILKDLQWYYDEPFSDTSMIPTFKLSEFVAQEQKLKVALAGDGGDEIFGGYRWYAQFFNQQLNKHQYHNAMYPYLGLSDAALFHEDFVEVLKVKSWQEQKYLVDCDIQDMKDLQMFDVRQYLPDDLLVKVDRASMANSLEVRVPFLDHLLVEKTWRFVADKLCPHKELKCQLKQLLKNFFPQEVIEKPKKGFSIPLLQYLDQVDFQENYFMGKGLLWGFGKERH